MKEDLRKLFLRDLDKLEKKSMPIIMNLPFGISKEPFQILQEIYVNI